MRNGASILFQQIKTGILVCFSEVILEITRKSSEILAQNPKLSDESIRYCFGFLFWLMLFVNFETKNQKELQTSILGVFPQYWSQFGIKSELMSRTTKDFAGVECKTLNFGGMLTPSKLTPTLFMYSKKFSRPNSSFLVIKSVFEI